MHSHYARATSRNLNLESLYQWARVKGINVVGTGDFTHPAWFAELQEKLEPVGNGLFRLKNPPHLEALDNVALPDIPVYFLLSTEISCIYKNKSKTRKNHNLVYAPDFETVAWINNRLGQIGNLAADGRPILGMASHDLLEIVLESSERSHFIPAHIWTPWFSTFGSKSGYDSLEDCFEDLTQYIFALETGLSSDPEMNWRWSALDRFTLVSSSDAHSPQKLGREANLFDTELSYDGLFNALKSKEGFEGTYEFFPHEGKYHLDGHRKCGIVWEPEMTKKHDGLCPVCGKKLTIGVLHRVIDLADREQAQRPEGAQDFHYIIPLPEILSEIKGVSPNTKTVNRAYREALAQLGNEFTLLRRTPVDEIKKYDSTLAEAIRRMRAGEVYPQAGFDGEFGKIRVFGEGEIIKQGSLF